MNMTTTGAARDAVLGATGPDDVFGPAGDDSATRRAAKQTFRRYALALHPDRVGDSAALLRLEQHRVVPETLGVGVVASWWLIDTGETRCADRGRRDPDRSDRKI